MHPLIEEMAVKYKEDRNTDHETAKKELLEKFTYAAYKLHGTTVSTMEYNCSKFRK